MILSERGPGTGPRTVTPVQLDPGQKSFQVSISAMAVAGILALVGPSTRALADDLPAAVRAPWEQSVHPGNEPPPLAPAVLVAMVAALPKHLVPLTVDFSDGYTFSGVQRTIKTGAIEAFSESPIGPFTLSFHDTQHILSWNRGEQDDFLNCDPTQAVHSVSESITNSVVVHYTADASGTPGEVTAVNVVIPTFQGSPPTTTSPFPITDLTVSVTITFNGETVSGVLTPAEPPPGAQANYLVTFPVAFPLDGSAQVDVSFTGAVQPALGAPQTVSLGCPPPNENLEATQRFGVTQLILQNTFVVLFLEEDVPATPPVVVIAPSSATVLANGSRVFDAFSCPVDMDGNPDFGPDGAPGTSDDLCTPVSVEWATSSGFGSVSPMIGVSTTFTAPDVPADGSASGAVLARFGTDIVFGSVFVVGADGVVEIPSALESLDLSGVAMLPLGLGFSGVLTHVRVMLRAPAPGITRVFGPSPGGGSPGDIADGDPISFDLAFTGATYRAIFEAVDGMTFGGVPGNDTMSVDGVADLMGFGTGRAWTALPNVGVLADLSSLALRLDNFGDPFASFDVGFDGNADGTNDQLMIAHLAGAGSKSDENQAPPLPFVAQFDGEEFVDEMLWIAGLNTFTYRGPGSINPDFVLALETDELTLSQDIVIEAVPEPSMLALGIFSLATIGWLARRRSEAVRRAPRDPKTISTWSGSSAGCG